MTRPATMTIDPSLKLEPAQAPQDARAISVGLAQGSYAQGTVLGEVTATPGRYLAYDDGGTDDGRKTAKAILVYACEVDASHNIAFEGEWGVTRKVTPAYVAGIFACEDLTGLDAAAVEDLQANVFQGNTTTGLLKF